MILSPMTVIWIMFGLILKHFICDFLIQTKYQYSNKHIWGHPGGILHASLHIIGTIVVGYMTTPQLIGTFVWLAIVEGIIHYIIDYVKMNINISCNWKADTHDAFWILLGADQLAHYLCYIGILLYIV